MFIDWTTLKTNEFSQKIIIGINNTSWKAYIVAFSIAFDVTHLTDSYSRSRRPRRSQPTASEQLFHHYRTWLCFGMDGQLFYLFIMLWVQSSAECLLWNTKQYKELQYIEWLAISKVWISFNNYLICFWRSRLCAALEIQKPRFIVHLWQLNQQNDRVFWF